MRGGLLPERPALPGQPLRPELMQRSAREEERVEGRRTAADSWPRVWDSLARFSDLGLEARKAYVSVA